MPAQFPAAVIENLEPLIEGGRYPIKRVIGEDVVIVKTLGRETEAPAGAATGSPADEAAG